MSGGSAAPRVRGFFVAGILLVGSGAGTAALVDACNMHDSASDAGADDASVSNASDVVTVCPRLQPEGGASCNAPEGTTCGYGQCSGIFYRCSSGTWMEGSNQPVPSGCPETIPEAGTDCPACFMEGVSCDYEQGCADDASAGATQITCHIGKWLAPITIACTFDASVDDGATDAGDGGEEAGDASDGD